MKKLLYYTAAVAAFGLIASVALAQDHTHYRFTYGHTRAPLVWNWNTHNAIQHVELPTNAAERDRMADEDALWMERCKPVIRHDAYGVGRYVYAAPGCNQGQYWNEGE